MKQISGDNVGVIVGRFQVDVLTDGHKDLINHAIANHHKVVILLGLSPCKCTVNNPLDFEARRLMIMAEYPDVTVLYIKDVPSDIIWSKNLDNIVGDQCGPEQGAMLYGSRDSFIQYYLGRYPTTELEQESFTSGTDRRNRLAAQVKGSADFRHGVVWATRNQYSKCLPTIDSAVFSSDKTRLLLARKDNESEYRFIGGFTQSGETHDDACVRETKEESHVVTSKPEYVGSFVINDWRYKNEVDKITSILFESVLESGKPQPDDDIIELKWFPFDTAILDIIRPEHNEMAVALLKKYNM